MWKKLLYNHTLHDQGLEEQYNINITTVIITNSSSNKVLCSLCWIKYKVSFSYKVGY